jgi:hypothetical protein
MLRLSFIGLLFSIFITTAIHAQIRVDSSSKIPNPYIKRAYVAMAYGFAIPMGSFASNSSTPGSAFAKKGSSFELIDFGYRLNEAFSLRAFYLNAANGIAERDLSNSLQTTNGTSYRLSEHSNYELKALFIGLGLCKPANSLDFELDFLLGYGNSFSPSLLFVKSNSASPGPENFSFQTTQKSGLGVGLSSSIRIHFNKEVSLFSAASYLIMERKLNQMNTTDGSINSSPDKISYELLSITFGLAYRFIHE